MLKPLRMIETGIYVHIIGYSSKTIKARASKFYLLLDNKS